MKKRIALALTGLLILGLVGCSKPAETKPAASSDKKPVVTIEMESGDKMKIALDPSAAPNTVNNFISLAQKGFYDGLTFHRVIKGFMIQGGDPEGTGVGGPGYSIKGEFSSNGVENPIKHVPGVISMARSQVNDSGGSQFFIMHGTAESLDGQYAAFGQVTEGLDIVDKVANVETDGNDMPLVPVKMKKVTVELNGYEFKEPETIKE